MKDPFSGSGMTGLAARYVGCDVIPNELFPAASFVSYNFCRTVDVGRFQNAISTLMDRITLPRQMLYQTKCRECDKEVESKFFVCS